MVLHFLKTVVLRAILRSYGRKAVLILLASLGGSAFVPAQISGRCTPSFPFQDGWWGADAAYSIPLPGGRSVWIFGDTLYGDKRVVVGNEPRMVRNSIGISRCDDKGQWSLQYAIRHGEDGKPRDFFQARILRPRATNTCFNTRFVTARMEIGRAHV